MSQAAQAEGRVARTGDVDAVKQAHSPVHVQAEIGHVGRFDSAEFLGPAGADVGADLLRRVHAPVGADTLLVQRREFPLHLVDEGEVELERSPVLRWRRVVRVSRKSWSLSWQKKTTWPPIFYWSRRAVTILA